MKIVRFVTKISQKIRAKIWLNAGQRDSRIFAFAIGLVTKLFELTKVRFFSCLHVWLSFVRFAVAPKEQPSLSWKQTMRMKPSSSTWTGKTTLTTLELTAFTSKCSFYWLRFLFRHLLVQAERLPLCCSQICGQARWARGERVQEGQEWTRGNYPTSGTIKPFFKTANPSILT